MARAMEEPLISVDSGENDEVIPLDFGNIIIKDGVAYDVTKHVDEPAADNYNLSYKSFCCSLVTLFFLVAIFCGFLILPVILNIDIDTDMACNCSMCAMNDTEDNITNIMFEISSSQVPDSKLKSSTIKSYISTLVDAPVTTSTPPTSRNLLSTSLNGRKSSTSKPIISQQYSTVASADIVALSGTTTTNEHLRPKLSETTSPVKPVISKDVTTKSPEADSGLDVTSINPTLDLDVTENVAPESEDSVNQINSKSPESWKTTHENDTFEELSTKPMANTEE